VTIPYGTSSVPYSVHVEEGTGYRLFYVLDSNESFMEYGYYADSGVYTDKKMAKVFNVYNQTSALQVEAFREEKNLGKLIVPDGAFENEGYFEVAISATTDLTPVQPKFSFLMVRQKRIIH